ncbi:MAG: hypothetical protein KatS3mg113_0501 [Planctomycetaceae bacterium]|nr:MAG: hypothetical protein KatS3mg113_0501 [Planctomycetaceae bacterium]
MTMRGKYLSLAQFCAWLMLAGCSQNPQAQFAWREATLDLLPQPRQTVQKTILEHFGTPHELVAWDRLPVNYGGVRGQVSQLEGDKLIVTWRGDVQQVKSGDPVLWLSGPLASTEQAADTVRNIDPATGALWLQHSSGEIPAGAELAVGFGEIMRRGRMAYMKNCHHCHGVAGDGNGPTARYLNPRPRDYRLGEFKFTSTKAGVKIRRDDLWRIIKEGIPGTYMPSFLLLSDEDTAAIVEYVRWLAMRGEMEKRIVDELTADYSQKSIRTAIDRAKAAGEKPPSESQLRKEATESFKEYLEQDYPGMVNDTADIIADAWVQAEDPENVVVPKVPRVADTPESRERGRLLFLSDKAKCYTCHGPMGRGDGSSAEEFWAKPGSNEKYERRGLHDTWGNPLPPRDLTRGEYRGGRRPIDIFRRIHAGIKGTPMPAFGGTVLQDEDIWDLVNYVMSLPYQKPSPSGTGSTGSMAAR